MRINDGRTNSLKKITLIFLVCFIFRFIEYLFIKTDQTVFAENFIHKVIGIVVLFISVKKLKLTFKDIGIKKETFFKYTILGLIIGLAIYSLAYAYEYLSLLEYSPNFQIFVSAYSLDGNYGNNTGVLFILMCIIFNIINVLMEEGVFRGLFITLLGKSSFWKANIVSSLFFGLWHITMPIVSVLNGERSIIGGIMMSLFYIATTFLMALALGCWYKITGSLWFGMAYHFVNNTIVNLLHIITKNGIDEMLSLRLAITQTIFSLVTIIVFVIFMNNKRSTTPQN